MKKTVASMTLGCKVNTYDTTSIIKMFKDKGYSVVNFDEKADVYLINTCTVTNLSDRKSRQAIRKAYKQNENAIIIATGCYAQTKEEEVKKIQEIDLIVGTKDRHKIVDIVESYSKVDGQISIVSDLKVNESFEDFGISEIDGQTRAYLKIQDGCNQYCSYCIIPYARGNIRSRDINSIIEEVKKLSKNGYKEIVLAGIHIASYGKDIKNIDLLDVIEEVNKIEGIERIRFSSVEPSFFTEETLKRLKSFEKVCDFFHLSLQSGSDFVLKNMNRKYNKEDFREAVKRIRSYYENVSITTDIIVGFPYEEDEHFEETKDFVNEIGFSKIHVFPYSKKDGTKASMLPQVKDQVKTARASQLRKISDQLEEDFINKFKNKNMDVLFEREKNCTYEGYTTNYIKVKKNSETNIINKIVNVKL